MGALRQAGLDGTVSNMGLSHKGGGGRGCEKGDREVGHAAFGTLFMQTGQTAWPGE